MRSPRWVALSLLSAAWSSTAQAEPSSDALLVRARQYEAEAEFEAAAAAYERIARESPGVDGASRGLARAVALRLGTEARKLAADDVSLFLVNYEKADPARASELVVTLANDYADHGDFDACRTTIGRELSTVFPAAEPHVAVRALLVFARCSNEMGDPEGARRSRQAGLAAAEALSLEALRSAEGRAAAREIAAALLAEGRDATVEAENTRLPPFAGAPTREAVLVYVKTTVSDWVRKRRTALDAAARHFERVRGLGELAPAAAQVESRLRLGQARAQFAGEFRGAPIPAVWKGSKPLRGSQGMSPEELRGLYHAAIDEASEPQKQAAKQAFVDCLEVSAALRRHDANTRLCQSWLSKNFAGEYPPPEVPQLTPGRALVRRPSAP
jgi:hypothetical protein